MLLAIRYGRDKVTDKARLGVCEPVVARAVEESSDG
jgi:hypothetical protein